jgi:integrase
MRFRRPNGHTAKLTLGPVDLSGEEADREPQLGAPLTLAAARRLAAEVQRLRALGRDVWADAREERRQRRIQAGAKVARSFATLARRFVMEHARRKTRRWKETARLLGLVPETLEKSRDGLVDRWGDRVIDDISTDDIYAVVIEAHDSGVPGRRPRNLGPSEPRARALFSCLSKFLGWLVARRLAKSNPCTGLARPSAPRPRERTLSDEEIRCFWYACNAIGSPFGPLCQLLLLTGARRDEVSRMTYDELADDGVIWILDGSRTKNRRPHTIPLSPLARECITSVQRIRSDAGYIFSTNGETPFSGFSKAKRRLDCLVCEMLGDGMPPWRLHDLRRTAATGMARAGADLHVIERTLNHVSGSFGGIVAVYQRHKFETEVKRALEAWANLLLEIVIPPKEACDGSNDPNTKGSPT